MIYEKYDKLIDGLVYPNIVSESVLRKRFYEENKYVPMTMDEACQKEKEYIKEETDKHKEAMTAYQKANNEILELFKIELFSEYGVTENPKCELCFKMAWDRGHSNGLREVESEFEDLVDLIK